MVLKVCEDKVSLGKAAAEQAAVAMRSAVRERGRARIVAASAASQFQFLDALTQIRDVPWKQVELFHLDEYIGLPMTHSASFCKFLHEHLIDKVGITNLHLMNGAGDPAKVIRSANDAVTSAPSTLPSSASGKTVTSRSTILRRISRQRNHSWL